MENTTQPQYTPVPRFREKTYKTKSGKSHTYYLWDGRGTGVKDIRLGKDRDAALQLWAKCEDGTYVAERKKAAPNYVLRLAMRKNKKRKIEIGADWMAAPAWVRRMYFGAEKRSKDKGRTFTLTPRDLLDLVERANGKCEVSLIPFVPNGTRSPYAASIDRIDSAKGYETGNVRLVCLAVNAALNVWGLDIALKVARAMIAATDQ